MPGPGEDYTDRTCDRDSVSSHHSSSSDSRGKKRDSSPYRKSRTRSPVWSRSRTTSRSPPLRTSRSRSRSVDKGHDRRKRSKSSERHSERRPSRRSPDYRHGRSREDRRHRSHSREQRSRGYRRGSRRSSSKGRSRSRERRRRSRSHDRWRDSSRRGQQYQRSDRRRSRSRDRQSHERSRNHLIAFQRASSSEKPEKAIVKPAEDTIEQKISPAVAATTEKASGLPLNTLKPGVPMTPQMAVQQAMAAMNAKAQALTGISLPTYYNPAAVNPLKYAEQVQKRKLLWQNKEKTEQANPGCSAKLWENLTFSQDQDGKMTAKFRKLMGIKSESASEAPKPEEPVSPLKKQEELFRDLDHQYEVARMSTHTHRGVGLGYSSQPAAIFPPSK